MKFNQSKLPLVSKQKGVTLILMAFLIGLLVTAFVIKSFDVASINSLRDANASKILADAKTALIGYSLSRIGAGERPGDMPSPDRLLTPNESPPVGGSPNYDGAIDSCTGIGTVAMNCFGRLPWQALGMSIPNPTQNDELGLMPWFAVSANLIDVCLQELNPNILNYVYPGSYPVGCPGTPVSGVLPHPWLTVRDAKGNILSNRVAIVLLLPGQAINGQTRPLAPLNGAPSYLDAVTVPAGCAAPCIPGTYSNADADNDFIMASGVAGSIADANDRILYITIDELINALIKRSAGEAKSVLNGYKATNTSFPYAAPLGATVNNFISSGTSNNGMVPIDGTDLCSCSSSSSCSCNYSLVNNVAHTRTSGGSYSSRTLGCNYSGRTCTCTGQGTCQAGSRRFSCDSVGTCTFTGSGGVTRFTYTPRLNHGNIASVSTSPGGCVFSGVNAICTGAGNFYVGLNVPTWFKSNFWQEYFYYQWDASLNLQVGSRTGVEALLIGTGSPILSAPFAFKGVAQTRPTALISDYLDSAENTDGNLIFDDTNVPHSASYNDQSFIVSP